MAVRLISLKRFGDERGWFAETYSESKFAQLGIREVFRQDNHSMSVEIGVLRGLHFQRPPHAQAKLVRCIRGRIFDVAVDIRTKSPTYARWVGTELSAENGWELFIPVGFAHGFITLERCTEVEYKVTSPYAPSSEAGITWNDPGVAVAWPLPAGGPSLSAKDKLLPTLSELESPFVYDGVPAELISA
jgi:dTDP-4-dehydrorhamnose 3,5-epimerase